MINITGTLIDSCFQAWRTCLILDNLVDRIVRIEVLRNDRDSIKSDVFVSVLLRYFKLSGSVLLDKLVFDRYIGCEEKPGC
jgi:hypothetical protein